MENDVENYEDYAYVSIDDVSYDILSRAEEYMCSGDDTLLRDVLSELQKSIEVLEKQAALIDFDVEYYDAQSRALGSTKLREQYLISKYKFSLIINKLNYFRSVKESINNLMGKGRELKK